MSIETRLIQLSPEDIWQAITQTLFLIYFSICCGVAVILVYLSQQVGERSILIDLGLVAIFGITSLIKQANNKAASQPSPQKASQAYCHYLCTAYSPSQSHTSYYSCSSPPQSSK
jgi:hypothetical protein